ncbi:unnamed protein product [Lactuca virosa]|uniref:Uncharacterized protein n=1 Tax=Lactuca virosa TaxID=75947 RepID=A0AAU9PKH6_9ASTR|nr:unnamed protein product [Lactuca virosa]
MFSTTSFPDLPEIRELRSLFADRYGNHLEPYINKEFVKKLKANPPTNDMKLQMMQEIAQECGIEWDYKAFEQKLKKTTSI